SQIIATLSFQEAAIPIVGNVTAQPLTTAESIKAELLEQLCNCIQWQRSIEYMVNNGVFTFIEIGPGKVLTGLTRRINKEARTINIGDLAAIRNLIKP
ncbi:ACP S-malonyltransferase, partial [Chloroflexota bacterium]